MKNPFLIAVILVMIVGAGAFYGGMKYQQSKMPGLPENFQRLREQAGQRAAQGLRPVNGTIISQDEESITIKLPDDSSKIILLTENSTINKTEEGSMEDLPEGIEVMVFGQENSDGSITAQNIQIGTGMFRRIE